MEHYNYQQSLHLIWDKAVKLYAEGERQASRMFSGEELDFLRSIGMSAQEMYDFAEDFNDGGEPDFTTVAMIQEVRREYFFEIQGGHPSQERLDPSTLPPKDQELGGIVWLPRIIEKARTKLRGELDPDTMYSCGGDRRFLRDNDIHPAEFLQLVWRNWNSPEAITQWVTRRRESVGAASS